MEKNGKLQLYKSELTSLQQGILPDRIATEWGLSLEEAVNMVNQGCYIVVP